MLVVTKKLLGTSAQSLAQWIRLRHPFGLMDRQAVGPEAALATAAGPGHGLWSSCGWKGVLNKVGAGWTQWRRLKTAQVGLRHRMSRRQTVYTIVSPSFSSVFYWGHNIQHLQAMLMGVWGSGSSQTAPTMNTSTTQRRWASGPHGHLHLFRVGKLCKTLPGALSLRGSTEVE